MKTAGLRKGIALFLAVVMMLGIGGMSVPTAQAAEYPDRGNAGGKAGNRYYTGPDVYDTGQRDNREINRYPFSGGKHRHHSVDKQ